MIFFVFGFVFLDYLVFGLFLFGFGFWN